MNIASRRCLDTGGDAVIRQVSCAEFQGQRWQFIANPADGTFQLRNTFSGLLLTPRDSATGNGTLVEHVADLKSADQLWRIIDPTHVESTVAVEPGFVKLKGLQSGHCIGYERFSEPSLAPMVLASCSGPSPLPPSARWELISVGGKRYALKNTRSGRCLDVKYGSIDNYAPLVQFDCHLQSNEQWVFTKGENGAVFLKSVLSDKVADVFHSQTALGSQIIQHDRNGGQNQQWLLVR
ncbi:RICIN domain-containing protein [Kibdelosporangium philippinense]|uniref:RICIN domain-containing protein n=2 Tax=Kibdelosporangium philippinense TaxID=211113 RepID=A0ABS8ZMT8_9PSEU|nr:RICIN domain-containing protein [Kibdelosporangium philippinense]MCE7008874.1 RICIN domain-containing protein [Kibdelosporangium philippinense]